MADTAKNILHYIEEAAGIASVFVPNPAIAAGLKYVGNLANTANTASTQAGADVPTMTIADIQSILPPDVLKALFDGKTVTIEINGKGLLDAFETLNKASTAAQIVQNAFKVK